MNNFDELVHFLNQHPPFTFLPAKVIADLATNLTYVDVNLGQTIDVNSPPLEVRIICSGGVEIRTQEGHLLDRLSAGGCFGYGPMLFGQPSTRIFTIIENGRLFLLDQKTFQELRHQHPEFDHFFARQTQQRIEKHSKNHTQDIDLGVRIDSIMHRNLITATPDTPIYEAAQSMTAAQVSSVLVCDAVNLLGIVTDRDLRTRVVAKTLDPANAISTVMTAKPICLSPNDSLYQGYLTMMANGIHHLPVVEDQQAVGLLSLSDLIRARSSEPLFFIQSIKRAREVAQLETLAKQIPKSIEKLILASVNADEISQIITTLTDSLTIQLLKMAETQFGPAPCKYCWLAFGSQGRQEQTLSSDQDNSFLLEDSATEENIQYFLRIGEFVCDGLDACGVVHCPGNIMAMNPKWCLPLKAWQALFTDWIKTPAPEALLNVSIFYDMRLVTGDKDLYTTLHSSVFNNTKGKSLFSACLLDTALANRPPLGFFKNFVLERDGNQNSVLDLKQRGTIPIVDLARLYCLSEGIAASNTLERIQKLKLNKVLHTDTADNLSDAHNFISDMRIQNQQKQLQAGHKTSNHLDPKQLSPLLRHQLKDAFSIVQECQQLAKMRFGRGMI